MYVHSRPAPSKPHAYPRTQLYLAISAMLVPVWSFAAPVVGPNGGVASGAATISQNGSVTNINQSSNKAIINWQSFSTAPNETVNFNQPNTSSITLNRVIGNEKSVLQGALNAPGKVYLVNKNGVLISKNATINTSGFVASTLNISDDDFNNGKFTFKADGTAGSVTNLGTITVTNGGYVVLLGNLVSNQGTITATKGTVSLNGGNKVTLNFNGDSLVSVTIDEGALNALVENRQAIYADGGQVIMTAKAADALLGAQVNNTGIVQAQTIGDLKGTIEIYAHGGTANVSGTLDASAPTTGNGGFIETSGDKVQIADSAVITTKAANGKSGSWLIDPTDFKIAASGGDMTGAALSTQLANNGLVTIESANGSTGVNGDINVNDAVSWSTDSTLSLNADRDININAPIKATGNSAGLVMTYGRDYNIRTKASYSGVADAPGPVYDKNGKPVYDGNGKQVIGPVAKKDTSGGVYGSITLSGADATLNINNQDYTLIHSVADLLNINNNPTGYYALADNLDLGTTTYNSALISTFSGTLAGLGHAINNLKINTPTTDNVGLIGTNADGSLIRDIGIVNASVTGRANVGILAGANFSANNISNIYTIGAVEGQGSVGGLIGSNYQIVSISDVYSNASATGTGNVGGLVGWSSGGANITLSRTHSTGAVRGIGEAVGLGGLVGYVQTISLTDSYATGDVTGTNKSDSVGGLVGYIGNGVGTLVGKTTNSYATGNVVGGRNVGGLIGQLLGYYGYTVENSHASGNVTGTYPTNVSEANGVGGLIGYATVGSSTRQPININNSFATGNVSANGYNGDTGGLIGYLNNGSNTTGAITNSFATGNVVGAKQGTNSTGGLVGTMANTSITNSHASGDVSGDEYVGGLVGHASVDNNGKSVISNSYAAGSVSGNKFVGSLIGSASDVTVNNSYWKSQEGQEAIGGGDRHVMDDASHGLNSEQLQDVQFYTDGTIDQVLTDRAAQAAAADKTATEKAEAIQQARIEDAGQQAGSAIQSLQQGSVSNLPNLSTANAAPSIDSQIVFADTENFSADVKSIVVDGVRFNLEDADKSDAKSSSDKDTHK